MNPAVITLLVIPKPDMQKTRTLSNESQRREQFGAGSGNSSLGASAAICHALEQGSQLPPYTSTLHH